MINDSINDGLYTIQNFSLTADLTMCCLSNLHDQNYVYRIAPVSPKTVIF